MIWALRLVSKIVLSRLPSGYALWQKMGIFRHGTMDSAPYALGVVSHHLRQMGVEGRLEGMVCLELGPGDAVGSALIARALGAERTILVDSGSFARQDMSVYARLAAHLEASGFVVPSDLDLSSMNAFLSSCRAQYFVHGLSSLSELPDASIDIVWSQAVLEHVREAEFQETMRQIRRVLKPSGACSHRVDLRDHLGGALNNLRFSRTVWESNFFVRSGFYTNRIRFAAMMDAFKAAGFDVELGAVDRWSVLPTRISSMSEPYRSMSRDELSVSGFDVVLRPLSVG